MWRWDGARGIPESFDSAQSLVRFSFVQIFTRRRGAPLSIHLQCLTFSALTLFSVNRQSYALIWIGVLVYITDRTIEPEPRTNTNATAGAGRTGINSSLHGP